MAVIQYILVCADDPVLAKKVRFLLARDECEVEILNHPSLLEGRLQNGGVALLILSRAIGGEDAVELLAGLDPGLLIPPTIILGGQRTVTADFIQIVPDPVDTQAIYRIASELLAAKPDDAGGFASDDDLTHLVLNDATGEHGSLPTDDDFEEVSGLEEIAGRLESLENDEKRNTVSGSGLASEVRTETKASGAGRPDALRPGTGGLASEARSETKSSGAGRPDLLRSGTGGLRANSPDGGLRPAKGRASDSVMVGGKLDPARFAKALFLCWRDAVTGALHISREQERLTVVFDEGSPIKVQSSIPGDPLGRQLVARGRISPTQYAEGAMRSIERGQPLGQSLVELDCFTPDELAHELATSAKEQIVACFEARQGTIELDNKMKVLQRERAYRLDIGLILAEGLRRFGDRQVVQEINGEIEERYFRLRRPIDELKQMFDLSAHEAAFLEFEGRAYNVTDASETSGLDREAAHKLMALLKTCDELEDFTPGVHEFEARIREERQRTRDIESRSSQIPGMLSGMPSGIPSGVPSSSIRSKELSMPPRVPEPRPLEADTSAPGVASPYAGMSPMGMNPPTSGPMAAPPSPPPPPPREAPEIPTFRPAPPAPSNGDADIPRMPVPPAGDEGLVPRPLVYAKPLPRGADGMPIETPERTLSREHFQRGVTLLGQGNFASAEDAFRDAVALCSEEHVYLIGLARAIYYNPGYRADGKVPVLKAIVSRAVQLAPDDKRVTTLNTWVQHAEHQYQLTGV